MPTGKLRARLAPWPTTGIAIIAVDPAYTRVGRPALAQAPDHRTSRKTTRHDAAGIAIGRRAQGHPIRRRTAPPHTHRSDRGGASDRPGPTGTAGREGTRPRIPGPRTRSVPPTRSERGQPERPTPFGAFGRARDLATGLTPAQSLGTVLKSPCASSHTTARSRWRRCRPATAARAVGQSPESSRGLAASAAASATALVQQAHPGGYRASREGREGRLGCADGDRKGRHVLVEVPRCDHGIPAAAGAVVSHEAPLLSPPILHPASSWMRMIFRNSGSSAIFGGYDLTDAGSTGRQS